MLPEKIRQLNVSIGDADNAGQLIRSSVYEFRYSQTHAEQAAVALLTNICAIGRWTNIGLRPL